MFGLVVMEAMTLSGHLSNINEIAVEFEIQMRHLEIFGPVVDKRPNHYCDRITPQQQSNF